METRLAIQEQLNKTPLSKIKVAQLKEWAAELGVLPRKGRVVRKQLEELITEALESITIYDKLTEFFDKEDIVNIMNSEHFDEEKLCSVIPYLCGKSDTYDENKMQVLLLLPDFFFRYGPHVDQQLVPDLRKISKEGRERYRLEEWNPWSLLREEAEIFVTQEKRRETYGSVVYDALEKSIIYNNITVYSIPEDKRSLYEEDPYASHPPGTVIFEYDPYEVVPLFFDTYPIMSYVILVVNKLPIYAAKYDHIAALDIVKKTLTNKDRYVVASVANREIVDFLLEKKDLDRFINDETGRILESQYGNGILSWLYDHMEDHDRLMHIIIIADNPEFYFRLREELKNDYRDVLYKYLSSTLLPSNIYIELIKEDPEREIQDFYNPISDKYALHSISWRIQLKIIDAFGNYLRRFSTPNSDLLKWAIDSGNVAFIYHFLEKGKGEEFIQGKKMASLHPLLYVYKSVLLSYYVKEEIRKYYGNIDVFDLAIQHIKNDEMIDIARHLLKEEKVNYTREQFIEVLKTIEETNRRAHTLVFDIIKVM